MFRQALRNLVLAALVLLFAKPALADSPQSCEVPEWPSGSRCFKYKVVYNNGATKDMLHYDNGQGQIGADSTAKSAWCSNSQVAKVVRAGDGTVICAKNPPNVS